MGMIKLIQSTWMLALIGSILFLATTVGVLRPSKVLLPSQRLRSEPRAHSAKDSFALIESNPEIEQMIAEIRKEKEALAEREQKLRQLEERLQSERAEINQVTQTVHHLQKQFDSSVVRV